jgi:hypothetical protein
VKEVSLDRSIRMARLWVRSLVRPEAVDRELDEELRFHLDRQIADEVNGLWLSGSAFPVLGVAPAAGRLLVPADDRQGCTAAVVLNYDFWRSEFGEDSSVVGRTMPILDRSIPVVGVTPPGFFGLEVGRRFDIALPTCAAALWGTPMNRRDYFWLSVMGRPDWTVRGAAQHLTAMSPAPLEATIPSAGQATSLERYRRFRLTAASAANGVSALRAIYTDALWALFAMTALVLLMACTNLTTLLLARATNREQEMAIRLAVGASARRLVAQRLPVRPHMTIGFTMFDTQIRDSLVRERLLAWLTGCFGAVVAALAAIGIYGVVAYAVRRRRHEVAIRVVIGAGREDIL